MIISSARPRVRREWLTALGYGAVVLVVVVTFVYRSPLVTYVSPPLDHLRRRASVLVPSVWVFDVKESHVSRDALLAGESTAFFFKPSRTILPH